MTINKYFSCRNPSASSDIESVLDEEPDQQLKRKVQLEIRRIVLEERTKLAEEFMNNPKRSDILKEFGFTQERSQRN